MEDRIDAMVFGRSGLRRLAVGSFAKIQIHLDSACRRGAPIGSLTLGTGRSARCG